MKRLNTVCEELAKVDFADTPAQRIGELEREEQIAHNSTILHEIYFEGIAEAPSQASGLLAQAMSRDFGSLDRWRAEFVGTGRSLASGSGWVILAYAPRDKRLFNHWAADDSMAPAGGVPLLAMDMYEHAYAADYGTDAAKYIETFVQAIKWTSAERLHREERRVCLARAAGHDDLRATTIFQVLLDRGGCLLLEGEGGDFGSREGLGGNPVKE